MDVYDRFLAGRVARGDTVAFARLYDRHAPRVYNLLRRLTRDSVTAEDLTQETFLTAWQSLANWRGTSRLSTYLCGIAINHYRNRCRREPETDPLEDTLPSSLTETDPLQELTRKEAEAALENAVAELPEFCREVFILVRMEGMTYREAAELLQVPLGTVQSRLARACQLLQIALADYYERSNTCPANASSKI